PSPTAHESKTSWPSPACPASGSTRSQGDSKMPWSPHDLPHIIEKAHTTYQHILHTYQTTPGFTEHPDYQWVTASCTRSIDTLDSPDLHWIDRDVCELVASTLETLPDWSPSACLPAESG